MKLTSQRLIASGALDIKVRFFRLLSLLERIASAAPPSERRILRTVIQETQEALSEYVGATAAVIQGGKVVVAKNGVGAPWPHTYRDALVRQVESGHESLRNLYSRAYPYINGSTSVPADLRHFLYRSLGLSMVSPTHREAIAIYPSAKLMWESTSTIIADDRAEAITASILIPYGEISAPARWPLLVHELGHHLSDGGQSSKKLRAEKLAEAGGILRRGMTR